MKTDCHFFHLRYLRHCLVIFVISVFATPIYSMAKPDKSFREYDNVPASVKEFYQEQHAKQTFNFVRQQREELDEIALKINLHDEQSIAILIEKKKLIPMTIWEALIMLDQLQDQSDPDFTLPNSVHALQTAEAIRRDLPKIAHQLNLTEENISWLILVGLLHDLGKVDALLRKIPQWAVVGDSFPVGCRFLTENIFHEFFTNNPDHNIPLYKTELGIYSKNVGINNLFMSFGHDEYAYQVLKNQGQLPPCANFIIRFHSFYPLHNQDAYQHFLSEKDKELLPWSKLFSSYDLYSKNDQPINFEELRPVYRNLINTYFPPNEKEIKEAPSRDFAEHKLLWPVLRDVQ
jgi:inositol oxygenase